VEQQQNQRGSGQAKENACNRRHPIDRKQAKKFIVRSEHQIFEIYTRIRKAINQSQHPEDAGHCNRRREKPLSSTGGTTDVHDENQPLDDKSDTGAGCYRNEARMNSGQKRQLKDPAQDPQDAYEKCSGSACKSRTPKKIQPLLIFCSAHSFLLVHWILFKKNFS
jgi:hypothetical protein